MLPWPYFRKKSFIETTCFLPQNRIPKYCGFRILNKLSNTNNSDQFILLKLCYTIIKSKLDYASLSILNFLNPIYHETIRLVIVAFLTFPILSIICETNETCFTHLNLNTLKIWFTSNRTHYCSVTHSTGTIFHFR